MAEQGVVWMKVRKRIAHPLSITVEYGAEGAMRFGGEDGTVLALEFSEETRQ